MNNNNETIDGIVAAIREDARRVDAGMTCPNWAALLRDLADRIEAAGQLDRSCAIKAAMMAKCEVCHSVQGSAAKMREALEAMLDECCSLCDVPNQMTESGHTCSWRHRWLLCQSKAIDKARDALAAPARNCDKFATAGEAYNAWDSSKWSKCGHDSCWRCGDFWDSADCAINWLFARAEGGAE